MNGVTSLPLSLPGTWRTHFPVKMPGTPRGKRRPRGALLQPVVVVLGVLPRVSGSRRSTLSGGCGGASVTPLSASDTAHPLWEQQQVGSLAGAVRP